MDGLWAYGLFWVSERICYVVLGGNQSIYTGDYVPTLFSVLIAAIAMTGSLRLLLAGAVLSLLLLWIQAPYIWDSDWW